MAAHLYFVGRLGTEPETKEVGENKNPLAVLNLATDKYSKDGKQTTWLRVDCWDHLAVKAAQHLKVGSQVAVTANLWKEKYQTDEGEEKTSWKIRANSLEFVGGRGAEVTEETKVKNYADDIPGINKNEEIPF